MPTSDSASDPGAPSPGGRVVAALALALAVILVYRPAFDFGFLLFDDPETFAHPMVRSGLTLDGIVWAFRHAVEANIWSPLTVISNMVDRSLFGMDPRGPHVVNVLLHAANASLLFLVLAATTGSAPRSFAATALWALHPLRVESVAWIVERKDVLCGLFWLLTLAAYRSWIAHRPSPWRYGLTTTACLGALLSKPAAVALPFALLLLDVWPLRRLPLEPDAATARDRVLEKSPWIAAAIATTAIQIAQASQIVALPLGSRLANALVGISIYLRKTFFPNDLAVLYPFRALPASEIAVAALVVAAISFGAFRARRRQPAILVGWLWFLLTLAPASGIVQAGPQALADRFSYFPAIGLAIAIVWAVPDGWLGGRGRPVAAVAVAVGIVGGAVLTRHALAPWRDQVSLFERALAVSGPDPVILVNLGIGHLARGDVETAVARMREATEVAPYSARARASYAAALVSAGQLEEASRQVEIVVQCSPGPRELETVAWVRRLRGDLDGSEQALLQALALDPASPEIQSALAEVRRTRGR